ncbi:LPXTG cell wall anchor domain-containing protein [Actinoplanes sp. LDG1-06]|uniref:LPXTG cell wall anchor domain-containing protein n=1 Tax=Paractinoplanes ovalisporus TaxID=2810368 RepID=A0ABS2AM60_9ACTN|nr:LPXTG cell wall anchor domain-containing protein [Actinoplanes ovalisporus]MBM2620921.1 LPXTG cell wall anchor domain-containing protein [Actinoplanes ovalisporus]
MRRIIAALLGAALALAPAAVAQAAPGEVLRVGNVSVAPGGTGEAWAMFSAQRNNQPSPFAIELDVTEASRLVTITTDYPCTITTTKISCPSPRTFSLDLRLRITAKPGVEAGATATLPARAVAAGTTRASATGRITIAEGVDLAAVELQNDVSIATGARADLAAGVRNNGDEPINGVVLSLRTAEGFGLEARRNCARIDHGFACRFADELAPGQEYRLATPFPLIAAKTLWAPAKWGARFEWSTEQDWIDREGKLPAGTSGPQLELAPVMRAAAPQTDVGPSANDDDFSMTITGVNKSNINAIGATAKAKPGETITVRVGVRNNGPARLEGYGAELGSYLTVGVTPPAGTTVVGTPKLCMPWNMNSPVPPPWPAGAHYEDGNIYCFSDDISWSPYYPGETTTWEFKLRVDRPGTLRGKIFTQVVGPSIAPQGDSDPADDDAAIVITAAAAGGGAGGGGGGLPITGSNTTLVAVIGLALLLAGAAAMAFTRRRR